MNIGYSRFGLSNTNNQVCPVCGKNIYVYKRGIDFACEDINCSLGSGAKELINKIQITLSMINDIPQNRGNDLQGL